MILLLLFSHWLLANPQTAACQASLLFTFSWSLLKLMSTELMMTSNHLTLCHPLLLLPSIFPKIRVFSNESVLHVRWPSTRASASASVIPRNIQDWFSLGWTGLISLQSRDSQESSLAPQLESINSSVLRPLYGPTLTCVHDYWKYYSVLLFILFTAPVVLLFTLSALSTEPSVGKAWTKRPEED